MRMSMPAIAGRDGVAFVSAWRFCKLVWRMLWRGCRRRLSTLLWAGRLAWKSYYRADCRLWLHAGGCYGTGW